MKTGARVRVKGTEETGTVIHPPYTLGIQPWNIVDMDNKERYREFNEEAKGYYYDHELVPVLEPEGE